MAPAGPLEEEVPGWTIPEQPALLVTPKVLGLPMPVTGTLVTVCLVLAIGLHTYAESLVLFLVLWLGGRRLLARDPFAWILLFLRPSVPRVLYPGGGGG